ncbi:UPF0481 protein At3g47200-like [Chenopodium quinoa]|uniref:UPF0481 protein At3g47200-like n=1 Tax=Chenopodium quinoa TaxID=63459 RepID=UPI000B78B847|nr:UPF0481 protein At3g47200-like [Chenopodium quinoa]
MENKPLKKPDQINNEVAASMKIKLESLPCVVSDICCIYKVPEFILKGNEEFYQPSVMSIGPVYYKDENLETMQEVKWIYLDYFLKNPYNAYPSLEPYINFVREKEWEIRGSYQHQFNDISSNEFIEMIVLDAAFLVYYFMCKIPTFENRYSIHEPSIENKLQGLMPYLAKDLFLLENQLPFFVFKEICNKAFGNLNPRPILFTLDYMRKTFGIPGDKVIGSIINGEKITDESSIKHLVDLQRMSCYLSLNIPLRDPIQTNPLCTQPNTNETVENTNITVDNSISYMHEAMSWVHSLSSLCFTKRENDEYDNIHLRYTAKKLKDYGVKFVPSESENPLEITFSKGKLKISKLDISDVTESLFRNLIYFEHCHYSKDSYFIDYIFFLDELVDTVEDVQVLIKSKIFDNYLGSDEDVKKLFTNIGKHLNLTTSYYYSDTCRDVNKYASTSWHRWMTIFMRDYCTHPWMILSVIVASIVFTLTVLKFVAGFTEL